MNRSLHLKVPKKVILYNGDEVQSEVPKTVTSVTSVKNGESKVKNRLEWAYSSCPKCLTPFSLEMESRGRAGTEMASYPLLDSNNTSPHNLTEVALANILTQAASYSTYPMAVGKVSI